MELERLCYDVDVLLIEPMLLMRHADCSVLPLQNPITLLLYPHLIIHKFIIMPDRPQLIMNTIYKDHFIIICLSPRIAII